MTSDIIYPQEANSIGKRIEECLKLRGVKKSWVQQQLNIGPNVLGRYIRGENAPSAKFIAGFCKLLKIRPEYLLYGKGTIDSFESHIDIHPLTTAQLLELQRDITQLIQSRLEKITKLS